MNTLSRLLSRWIPEPLPVLKPMPNHVRELSLDADILALHIADNHRPSRGTVASANIRSGEAK